MAAVSCRIPGSGSVSRAGRIRKPCIDLLEPLLFRQNETVVSPKNMEVLPPQ